MRYFLFVLFACIGGFAFAQEKDPPPEKERDTLVITKELDTTIVAKELDSTIIGSKNASAKRKGKLGATKNVDSITIKDYKIISFERDTTFLDTTLTIQKEYKYNYLRKDDFELMPFSNIGQPYNALGRSLNRKSLYPRIGAEAKHFNYEELQAINYYNVPTPMSDLFFKTTFEQGQLLDARLTFNTSRRLNFSVSYKGHRSLGKYREDQVQSGNFRATTNYETRNGRYNMRAHMAAQTIDAEENGGLLRKELQFESGNQAFQDRSRIDVRFTDANSKLTGRRYFLDHQYKLVRKLKDSSRAEKTSLSIGHQFNYETKIFDYFQTQADEYYGDSFLTGITDRARLKTMFNQGNITFSNAVLGRLQANVNLYNYNYFFNSLLITDTGQIDNQLKGEEVSVGANYEKVIKGFHIKGAGQYTISGDLTGSLLDATAGYRINPNNSFNVGIHSSSRMPNFNFLLFQSDYANYNWQNNQTYEKENVNSLFFNFDSKLLGSLSANYTTVDNYAYFTTDTNAATQTQIDEGLLNAFIKPAQETNSLNYLKLKYQKEFRLGKFALNNTVMYQNVTQTNQVLNLPELVTRNTLYYSSNVFKKAMFLQTGVTFKYFTEYTMNGFNPVLGEFYVQNTEKLGGFPMLDFFINAKVQQTRIYLKAEHFNSFFGKNNFYAAPDYPYRDFVIRFGLVWNFFS